MTRRPDAADRAQAAAKAAQHRACLCGDKTPCSCGTPSQGWRPWRLRPLIWGDVPILLAASRQPVDSLRTSLETSLRALSRKIDKIGKNMASQADVDAIAAALHQEDSDLNAAVAGISQKLADLQAAVDAGQPVDLSALQAEVDGLRGAVDSAAALVPAPAAPPADGGDAPVDGGDGPAPVDSGDGS